MLRKIDKAYIWSSNSYRYVFLHEGKQQNRKTEEGYQAIKHKVCKWCSFSQWLLGSKGAEGSTGRANKYSEFSRTISATQVYVNVKKKQENSPSWGQTAKKEVEL